MEDSSFRIAKIVGTPTEDAWAQVLSLDGLHTILWIEKGSPRSEAGESGQALELSSLGKELIVYLEETFAKNPQKSLASLKELFLGMIKLAPATVSVSFVAVQTVGNTLYGVLKGKGRAILQREGQIGTILGPSDPPVGGISLSSGLLEYGDVVVLETEQFQKFIHFEKLSEILQGGSFEEVSENIALIIHGQEDAPAAAAILLAAREHIAPIAQQKPQFFRVLAAYLKEGLRERRAVAVVAVFLIFLLVAGLVVRERSVRKQEVSVQEVLVLASGKYEEGQALLTLNRELARESLRFAKELLEKERPKFTSKEYELRFGELSEGIDKALEIALNITRIDNPSVFFDLKLIRDDIEVSALSLFGKTLLILDDKQSSIYSISLANKSFTSLSGGLKEPIHTTLTDRFAYVWGQEGLTRIEMSSKKATLLIEKEELEDVVSLVAFGSNLYVLDRKSSQIIKFVPVEEGKFSRKNYFSDSAKLDFSEAISMTIDGSIFVMFSDGTIRKYLEGRIDNFVLSGIDVPLAEPTSIFTNKDLDFVYVLDRGNQRVVVLKKNGSYEGQYVWEGIKDVTGFVVSEEEGKIFLLSGNKIYVLELK